ncbi:MAG: 4'-phosphopantetheinyl transferase superfamily protein [Ruminococcaceae bacterium]|nr:4'-phosphopantetheinyl transferase superfamily protein [Oscillospiraceae bacterium]
MSTAAEKLWIYLMPSDDSVSTNEKIQLLVKKYFSECGYAPNRTSEPVVIERTERGKPYFVQPSDLFVSVSHSGAYFVCALCSCPVGVDIQTHNLHRKESAEERIKRLRGIAKRFFHPDEVPLLEEDTVSRFFTLWTAKECYLKMTGQGIDDNFSQISPVSLGFGDILCQGETLRWCALDAWFEKRQITQEDTLCVCARKPFEITVCNLI